MTAGAGTAHPTRSIEARGLVRVYGDETAVDGVDLDVGAGEIHALVGLNGAGKTTLMRMLLGMVEPTSGSALLGGVDVRGAPSDVWRTVGGMTETPFAYPELTVTENLTAAAWLHGMAGREVQVAVERMIGEFELTRWGKRRARALSLGNRQRLGLATALIHQPRIMILDEPSNALDPAGVVFVRDLLRRSADLGAAILVSSHHLDQLARVAHRITILHRGEVIGALDPDGDDLEQEFFERVLRVDQKRGVA